MFFAFHDDVVAPTYVEELVGALGANERAVLAFSDMEVHGGRRARQRCTSFDELDGHEPETRTRPRHGEPSLGLVGAEPRTLPLLGASATVGGIHPNEQGEYSADWTWLLGLALIGEFVRVPEVLCVKYYRAGSVSKKVAARLTPSFRRCVGSGIAEIRRSSLTPMRKAMLTSYLWRRIAGHRLPHGEDRLPPPGLLTGVEAIQGVSGRRGTRSPRS